MLASFRALGFASTHVASPSCCCVNRCAFTLPLPVARAAALRRIMAEGNGVYLAVLDEVSDSVAAAAMQEDGTRTLHTAYGATGCPRLLDTSSCRSCVLQAKGSKACWTTCRLCGQCLMP